MTGTTKARPLAETHTKRETIDAAGITHVSYEPNEPHKLAAWLMFYSTDRDVAAQLADEPTPALQRMIGADTRAELLARINGAILDMGSAPGETEPPPTFATLGDGYDEIEPVPGLTVAFVTCDPSSGVNIGGRTPQEPCGE